MEKHSHEEHIVGKSGDYTAKGNIGDTWEKSAYTGGVSVKGHATLVDDTPDGSYDVKIKTNCDDYNLTLLTKVMTLILKKLQQIFLMKLILK